MVSEKHPFRARRRGPHARRARRLRPGGRNAASRRARRPSPSGAACARGRAAHQDARQAHHRHRQPGVRAVVQRQQAEQRQGLRVRRRVPGGRAARLPRARTSPGPRCTFNNAIAPGPKAFDFDINQFSITPERKQAVDFSSPYYLVRQTVITIKGSKIAGRKHDRRPEGRQARRPGGHHQLPGDQRVIKPSTKPQVFNSNDDAKKALQNGTVDGLVVDLPTAFYMTAAELDGRRRSSGSCRRSACRSSSGSCSTRTRR